MINFAVGLILLFTINRLIVNIVKAINPFYFDIEYFDVMWFLFGFIGTIAAVILTSLLMRLISNDLELKVLPIIFVFISWVPGLEKKFENPVYYEYKSIGALIGLIIGYLIIKLFFQ